MERDKEGAFDAVISKPMTLNMYLIIEWRAEDRENPPDDNQKNQKAARSVPDQRGLPVLHHSDPEGLQGRGGKTQTNPTAIRLSERHQSEIRRLACRIRPIPSGEPKASLRQANVPQEARVPGEYVVLARPVHHQPDEIQQSVLSCRPAGLVSIKSCITNILAEKRITDGRGRSSITHFPSPLK